MPLQRFLGGSEPCKHIFSGDFQLRHPWLVPGLPSFHASPSCATLNQNHQACTTKQGYEDNLDQKMLPSQMPLCQTIYMPGRPIVRSILVSIQSVAFSTSTQCSSMQLTSRFSWTKTLFEPPLSYMYIYIYTHNISYYIVKLSQGSPESLTRLADNVGFWLV